MKKIKITLNGEEPKLNLGVTKQNIVTEVVDKKETIKIEEHHVDEEIPSLGDTVEIPRDVLEVLLSKAKEKKSGTDKQGEDKFEYAIKKLTEAFENQGNSANKYLGGRPIDIHEIDSDDVLDVPAVFFAHSVSYMIYDDRRNGRVISTPYRRPFKFKKVIRNVTTVPGSRTPVYLSISAVFVNSKKEVEWLKKHSLFGIKFFEKMGDAKDISAEMQDKLVSAWNIVSSFDEHSIVQRCAREGIVVDTMDMNEMRRRLAKKMASNMMRDANERAKKSIQDFDKFTTGNIDVVETPKSTNENPSDLRVAEPTY